MKIQGQLKQLYEQNIVILLLLVNHFQKTIYQTGSLFMLENVKLSLVCMDLASSGCTKTSGLIFFCICQVALLVDSNYLMIKIR